MHLGQHTFEMPESSSFPDPSEARLPAPERETTKVLTVILLPAYHLYVLQMLHVNHPGPTHGKVVCVSLFCFLSSPGDFLTLLSPATLVYQQRISWDSLHILL